jgi:hypothetical protein
MLRQKPRTRFTTAIVLASSFCLINGLAASAEQLNDRELVDKESAKNANITLAKKYNGEETDADKESKKSTSNKSGVSDAKLKSNAKKTADAANSVPGVKVSPNELMAPPTQPPIKGFHPIKKMLRPIENLEGVVIKMEQQIMKLEGPIAGLQTPMLNLHKKMVTVDEHIGGMQTQLNGMQTEVTGVRSDLSSMRKDIQELKEPIVALKGPIGTVAAPLERLQNQLNFIILAIFVAAGAIAFGTPVAAVLLYKYRHKFFPGLKESDLPRVEAPPVSSGQSTRR